MSFRIRARRLAVAAIAGGLLLATPIPAAAAPPTHWPTGEPVAATCTTGGITAFDSFDPDSLDGAVRGWTKFCRGLPTDPVAVFGLMVFHSGIYEIQFRSYYGAEGVVVPFNGMAMTPLGVGAQRVVLCLAISEKQVLKNGVTAPCVSATLVEGQLVTSPTSETDPLIVGARLVRYSSPYSPTCMTCMYPDPQ